MSDQYEKKKNLARDAIEKCIEDMLDDGDPVKTCMARLLATPLVDEHISFLEAELGRETPPPCFVEAIGSILPLLMGLAMGPVIKQGKENEAIETAVGRYEEVLKIVIAAGKGSVAPSNTAVH